mmetsp:Transcript_95917/g.169530  ORF Transcript_95917/g.169530 Transcript_95917/m.169530 type:complete len:122 (-) Transcript_95917:938-1303(-)
MKDISEGAPSPIKLLPLEEHLRTGTKGSSGTSCRGKFGGETPRLQLRDSHMSSSSSLLTPKDKWSEEALASFVSQTWLRHSPITCTQRLSVVCDIAKRIILASKDTTFAESPADLDPDFLS